MYTLKDEDLIKDKEGFFGKVVAINLPVVGDVPIKTKSKKLKKAKGLYTCAFLQYEVDDTTFELRSTFTLDVSICGSAFVVLHHMGYDLTDSESIASAWDDENVDKVLEEYQKLVVEKSELFGEKWAKEVENIETHKKTKNNKVNSFKLQEKYIMDGNDEDPDDFYAYLNLPVIGFIRLWAMMSDDDKQLFIDDSSKCDLLETEHSNPVINLNTGLIGLNFSGDALITCHQMGYDLTNKKEVKRIKKEKNRVKEEYQKLVVENPDLFDESKIKKEAKTKAAMQRIKRGKEKTTSNSKSKKDNNLCFICDDKNMKKLKVKKVSYLFTLNKVENYTIYSTYKVFARKWSDFGASGYVNNISSPIVYDDSYYDGSIYFDYEEFDEDAGDYIIICEFCTRANYYALSNAIKTETVDKYLKKNSYSMVYVDLNSIMKEKKDWKSKAESLINQKIEYQKEVDALEKEEEKRIERLKQSIVNLLKEKAVKMPASDIDAHLRHQDVDEIKEYCEEMYINGEISRTGNYRYFILTEQKKKTKSNKASAPKSEKVDVKSELKKFKEMLDEGLITQEDYDAKKKELLGL